MWALGEAVNTPHVRFAREYFLVVAEHNTPRGRG